MDQLVGKTVAQYTLQRKIGRGSLATVFEAQATAEKPLVAVKVISEREFDATSDTKRRFRQLADKLVHLNHPNILAVTQCGIETNLAFLVMPLVEGGKTLRDRLRQGVLGRWRAIELVKQVASALDYAHQRGVLHLDLKPSNVLVDPHNWPWVTDFGLANVIQGQQPDNRSVYVAPEQVLGKPVDQRTDIYALGVVMYEILTGTLPYSSVPDTDQLAVSPRTLNPNISESLAQVTLRAVALKPADRYSSAADFLTALDTATEDDSYREPYVQGLGDIPVATPYSAQNVESSTGDMSVKPPFAPGEEAASPADAESPVIIPLPKSTTTERQEAEPEIHQADTGGRSQTNAGETPNEETGSQEASEDENTASPADDPTETPLTAQDATVAATLPEPPEQEAIPIPASEAGAPPALGDAEPPPSTVLQSPRTFPNWSVPIWVTVLGLGFVLVLIVWAIFAQTLSNSFSTAGATQTAAAAIVAEPTATNTPVIPSPTATAEPSSTPLPPTPTLRPPSPTATLAPTETALPPTETPPVSLPSPTPSAAPTEEMTPTSEIPVGQWSLISPAEGGPATSGLVQFEWTWTGERLPTQGFEIKVWRPGQPPLGAHDAVADNQSGLINQTGENSYSIELDITNAQGVQGVTSRYLWTVALIQISPEYIELGEQAEPGTLEYLGFRGPEDIVDNSTEPVDNSSTFPQNGQENSPEAPVDNGG